MSQDYSYLKKISNTFDGEKSLTEILESFRCISKDYNNIKIENYKMNNLGTTLKYKHNNEIYISVKV